MVVFKDLFSQLSNFGHQYSPISTPKKPNRKQLNEQFPAININKAPKLDSSYQLEVVDEMNDHKREETNRKRAASESRVFRIN